MMGLVLDEDDGLPDGWAAEVRRESFYLYPPDDRVWVTEHVGERPGGTIEFMSDDIPAIRACLDAVEARTRASAGDGGTKL
jgi:hypothetical protein